jgi:hypothetical protein
MSAVPAHLRAKGWSEAKAFAATMLRKNPNTYFYRHVAPHETQVWFNRHPSALCAKMLTRQSADDWLLLSWGDLPITAACVLPVCLQAQGEWTQEEHELFMSTAKQHGVGDKWGLFSSYIPQVSASLALICE